MFPYEDILYKIVNIQKEVGMWADHSWRGYSLKEWDRTADGEVILEVDYQVPKYLHTPAGTYTFGSLGWSGDEMVQFWNKMYQSFDISVSKEKRSDVECSEFEKQCTSSGPYLIIKGKTP